MSGDDSTKEACCPDWCVSEREEKRHEQVSDEDHKVAPISAAKYILEARKAAA